MSYGKLWPSKWSRSNKS